MYESKDKEVSHPDHYKGVYGMECFDVIRNFTADLKGMEAVDTANAIKYILRWNKKGGIQDIEKAIFYLTDLRDTLAIERASDNISKIKETINENRKRTNKCCGI